MGATTYFLYDGDEIIEERDGSENLIQQFVYGPNHIRPGHDEVAFGDPDPL